MTDAIVVLNAGSSSLKFSIYDVVDGTLAFFAGGQVDGVGTAPRLKVKDAAGRTLADEPVPSATGKGNHQEAFAHLQQWVKQNSGGHRRALAVGHRMAHGGQEFVQPTLINEAVLRRLEQLIPLVPLHQPHNLAAVKAVTQLRPDLPQVACFDTAFHQGRARVTERFGLPDALFKEGLRRWGFHGLSYEYIAGKFRQLDPALAEGRVIAAHLGSGASLCAMRHGKSVDTTMSFSALDGLLMGTRCGSLDPGVVLHLLRNGMTVEQVENMLYKQSGLLGVSGISNDIRQLLASDQPQAAEAIEFFIYRIIREIGSLVAALGGLDALIFTAGVGENSPLIRRRVCQGLTWLGVELDEHANEQGQGCISPPGRRPAVWVIPTNEEWVIASHTLAVVRGK